MIRSAAVLGADRFLASCWMPREWWGEAMAAFGRVLTRKRVTELETAVEHPEQVLVQPECLD